MTFAVYVTMGTMRFAYSNGTGLVEMTYYKWGRGEGDMVGEWGRRMVDDRGYEWITKKVGKRRWVSEGV